jgi:prephenate dehydrogenase
MINLPVIQPEPPRSSEPPIFDKIAVVGLGLIGGSIALAAKRAWPAALVLGVDRKDVLEVAVRLHAVDVAAEELFLLSEADLVILAAPIRQNVSLLAQMDDYVATPAIVTDTGSTKRGILKAARSLPERLTFIGGHPVAGAARGGLERAHPDLFRGRPWLLTPPADGQRAALEKLSAFVQRLGAIPHVIDPARHDRMLAFLSHLPQLTASALMNAVGEAVGVEGLALSGRGLADTTRLASSPPEIWRDIVATNADELAPALDALIDVLQDLRDDLATGTRLTEVFTAAERWRDVLKKTEPQP